MQNKRSVIIGCLCAFGCETLYGLSYLFTRQATRTASAFALLGWRFFIAAAVMCILAALHVVKIDVKGKSAFPLLRVSLFCPCLYFIAETLGISLTSSSESGAFLACIPAASLVASTLILKKKPTAAQGVGVAVTLSGVLMTVFAAGGSADFSAAGYLFLAAAVLTYALYSVFAEKAEAYTAAELTLAMLIGGAVLFVPLSIGEALIGGSLQELITLPFVNADFLTAVLYQGLGCSIGAFFLSNAAISKIGVNRTSSFIGVAAVVSIAAGALAMHEQLSPVQLAGAAVIVGGVYIANIKRKSGLQS